MKFKPNLPPTFKSIDSKDRSSIRLLRQLNYCASRLAKVKTLASSFILYFTYLAKRLEEGRWQVAF